MNERHIRNAKLEEKEILNIFSQICKAVELMHSQKPPIAHRDLKVENILYHDSGAFKLCDFGSSTTSTYLPTTERERNSAEEDINRNTTMTYRAPEMVDLYLKLRINEKVDIWALGCILFKMAFCTDPFEAGALAILNSRYTFPEFHSYSQDYLDLVVYLLNADPEKRPNIFQVQERVAKLRGVAYKKLQAKPLPVPPAEEAQVQQSAPKFQQPTVAVPTANIQAPNSAVPQSKKNLFDMLDWETTNDASLAQQSSSTVTNATTPKAHLPPETGSVAQNGHSKDLLHELVDSEPLEKQQSRPPMHFPFGSQTHSSASVPNQRTTTIPISQPAPSVTVGNTTRLNTLDWNDAPKPTLPLNAVNITSNLSTQPTNTSAPPSLFQASKSTTAPPGTKPPSTSVASSALPSQSAKSATQAYTPPLPTSKPAPHSASTNQSDFLGFDPFSPAARTAQPPSPTISAPVISASEPDLLDFSEPRKKNSIPLPKQSFPSTYHQPSAYHQVHPQYHQRPPQFAPQYASAKPAAQYGGVYSIPGIQQIKPPTTTGNVEDFDPLAPSKPNIISNNSDNTSNTTASTAENKNQLIHFF